MVADQERRAAGPRVLVAGADLDGLAAQLSELGYAVCAATRTGREAIDAVEAIPVGTASRPELALIDPALAGEVSGIAAAEQLRRRFGIPVIYVGGFDLPPCVTRAARMTEPAGYLSTPVAPWHLQATIDTVLAQHRRETESAERLRLLQAVLDSMYDGVVATDANGRVVLHNSCAAELAAAWQETACRRESPACPADAPYGAFHPDGRTPVAADDLPLARASRGERLQDVELLIRTPRRPQGVSVSVSSSALPAAAGTASGKAILFRDVSAIKRTRVELRDQLEAFRSLSALLRTVVDSIGEGLVVVDRNGKYLITNPAMERLVGTYQPSSDLSQRSQVYGLYYPDRKTLIPSDRLPLARALRGESTDLFDVFIRNERRPQGVLVSTSARPLYDAAGVMRGGVVLMRDITKLKDTQWKLKETARRMERQRYAMQTVIDSISEGVVVANAVGKLSLFNPSAERILGIGMTDVPPEQRAERYGVYYLDQTTPVPAEDLPLTRAVQGEATDEAEFFIRNSGLPGGGFISVNGRPLRDSAGALNGGVVVIRDVTERLRAHQTLQQAFAQGRLEVLDTIVHNIGNAINSVAVGVGTIGHELEKGKELRRFRALASAMKQHRDDWHAYLRSDPQGRQVLPFVLALAADFEAQNQRLIHTVQRIRGRVAHIVDLIRTQRSFDNRRMTRKLIRLSQSISDATKVLTELCASRGIKVEIDCSRAPRELWIQESQFHQMIVNLVKNAVEAIESLAETEHGQAPREPPRIRIECYLQDELLVLDVIDNGIGIGKQRDRLIFTAGYTTKDGGSGLGLHSAANFVIGSGGSIQALSEGHGKGATIRVSLRRAATTAQQDRAEPGAAPTAEGHRFAPASSG